MRGHGFKIDVGQYNQKNVPTYHNCNAKKGKEKHMQSLLEVFCVFHMPTLGVVNIKKWKLNNVSESNPNWKGITITFLPM